MQSSHELPDTPTIPGQIVGGSVQDVEVGGRVAGENLEAFEHAVEARAGEMALLGIGTRPGSYRPDAAGLSAQGAFGRRRSH